MKRHASMNRVYRLVWSQVQNAWVAVAETARGRGKNSSRKLIAAALSLGTMFAALLSHQALAAPSGGQVVAGSGSIVQSGASTNITQASQNLSLNWQSFNVAAQETVTFLQPSAAAIAVNRIFDTNGSQILGHLNANGQVYLINPNGILFGQGAQVNVGGLVASTLDIANASNGSVSFAGSGAGSVINQGAINAAGNGHGGGYVALLGNTVSNQGTISAQLGTVALGAGSAVTLTFSGNSLVQMQVDQSTLNNLAENGGLIRAEGGTVLMKAGAKNELLASVVNNTGVIEAQTVDNHEGVISLIAGMSAGTVKVAGTLDASAPNGGNGGFIETSAASVKVADTAMVTTAAASGLAGTWLIDPVDFTIAATGGDTTGLALSNSLGLSSDVTIQTSTGNVNVNDVVNWSANKLTLNAWNNININANLNASSAGKLALVFGQSAVASGNTSNIVTSNAAVNLPAGTSNFTTRQGSDGITKNYTVITSLGAVNSSTQTDLQGMRAGLNTNYALGSDIDATATSGWNSGQGFIPVGKTGFAYNGIFDGLGHSICNLTINRPTTDYVGLFGYISSSSSIVNVGMVGGSVNGRFYVGGLLGYNYGGTIYNSYATGSVVSGAEAIGGLVGGNYGGGTISNSYSTNAVSGTSGHEGGLAGDNYGTIRNSYATGTVSGNNNVGGLVGGNANIISNSYATGGVSGPSVDIGGLVGGNGPVGNISNSYATGSVNGANE